MIITGGGESRGVAPPAAHAAGPKHLHTFGLSSLFKLVLRRVITSKTLLDAAAAAAVAASA